ncbi:ERMES complex subunit mmm1 [Allomyces javanicus]|nr:ERMES complex subunit mmm1 [Allomyces javanicus]
MSAAGAAAAAAAAAASSSAASSGNDELLVQHLVHAVSSQATAQFVKGLLLGILLTVGAALIAARTLLFHSPRGSSSTSRQLLLDRRRRGRTASTLGTASLRTPLPLPLSSLILLHRQLVAAASAATSAPGPAAGTAPAAPQPQSDPTLPALDAPTSVDGETLAFANFLLAEVLGNYRSDPRFIEWIKVDLLQAALNKSLPSFVDRITVTDFLLGHHDQFPLFRKARLRPVRPDGGAAARSSSAGGGASHRGGATTAAVNERWRIELEIELANLSEIAKQASTWTQANHHHHHHHASSTGTSAPSVASRSSAATASTRSRKLSTPAAPPPAAVPQRSPSTTTLTAASTSSTASPPPPPASEPDDHDADPPRSFLELGLETQLVLNWPRASLAALPIHLLLEVTALRGTLAIEFHPATTDVDGSPLPAVVTLSLLQGYQLQFRISSLLGSRTKVRDVPKIADLITMTLRTMVQSRIVEPNYIAVPLPGVPDSVPTDQTAAAPADTEPAPAPAPVSVAPQGDEGHVGDDEAESDSARATHRRTPASSASTSDDDTASARQAPPAAATTTTAARAPPTTGGIRRRPPRAWPTVPTTPPPLRAVSAASLVGDHAAVPPPRRAGSLRDVSGGHMPATDRELLQSSPFARSQARAAMGMAAAAAAAVPVAGGAGWPREGTGGMGMARSMSMPAAEGGGSGVRGRRR